MVKSNKVYSPSEYLEAVTGKYYIIRGEDDISEIQNILAENGWDTLWDRPLSEIGYILENKLDVVLVDCMMVDEETDEFEHIVRWFEVPEDFKEEN